MLIKIEQIINENFELFNIRRNIHFFVFVRLEKKMKTVYNKTQSDIELLLFLLI